jgi:hypothetical protein
MKFTMHRPRFVWLAAICLARLTMGDVPEEALAEDLKLEVRLIWGTNDKESPNPQHKSIDTPLTRKLAKLFTWKNYFEVNRQEISLALNAAKKVKLREKCLIEVKHLGDARLEVKLYGSGKFVSRTLETIPTGDWLVLAGDSENKTAWFVVLKAVPHNRSSLDHHRLWRSRGALQAVRQGQHQIGFGDATDEQLLLGVVDDRQTFANVIREHLQHIQQAGFGGCGMVVDVH